MCDNDILAYGFELKLLDRCSVNMSVSLEYLLLYIYLFIIFNLFRSSISLFRAKSLNCFINYCICIDSLIMDIFINWTSLAGNVLVV